ncbi:uncharacterized protein BDR25DRAFT_361445 [Lindgomyces ingoldianus]|uniref:Uncharacterized protein n=1 Tax=Lindgomyces ingoldianus TaxID=673940 RepID=A0ACB6QCI8_9PLEO|nr:uncharacterized protein BDR25DRAFT_361445 [Lindgomyces ingoldianus]KAF2464606.1 hypothetical protein BDR25DRAFT_361445 [Lindgomyces ingoldianus]
MEKLCYREISPGPKCPLSRKSHLFPTSIMTALTYQLRWLLQRLRSSRAIASLSSKITLLDLVDFYQQMNNILLHLDIHTNRAFALPNPPSQQRMTHIPRCHTNHHSYPSSHLPLVGPLGLVVQRLTQDPRFDSESGHFLFLHLEVIATLTFWLALNILLVLGVGVEFGCWEVEVQVVACGAGAGHVMHFFFMYLLKGDLGS